MSLKIDIGSQGAKGPGHVSPQAISSEIQERIAKPIKTAESVKKLCTSRVFHRLTQCNILASMKTAWPRHASHTRS